VAQVVEDRTAGKRRLWFVESRLWHMDPSERTPRVLEERFERLDSREFDGVRLKLYELE